MSQELTAGHWLELESSGSSLIHIYWVGTIGVPQTFLHDSSVVSSAWEIQGTSSYKANSDHHRYGGVRACVTFYDPVSEISLWHFCHILLLEVATKVTSVQGKGTQALSKCQRNCWHVFKPSQLKRGNRKDRRGLRTVAEKPCRILWSQMVSSYSHKWVRMDTSTLEVTCLQTH